MRTVTVRRLAFVLIIAGVIAASFGVAYSLSAQDPDTPGPDDEPQPGGLSREDLEALRDADHAKPRFTGELLGFYIAGLNEQPPAEFVGTPGCPSREEVANEKAGQFGLDLRLERPFVLDEAAIETGVVACGGVVRAASWKYIYPQAYPGHALLSRSDLKYLNADFSKDRVYTQLLGGREAIILAPIRTDGMNPVSNDIWGSDTAIVFPEEFGSTIIQTRGVPFDVVLDVAKRIGEATK